MLSPYFCRFGMKHGQHGDRCESSVACYAQQFFGLGDAQLHQSLAVFPHQDHAARHSATHDRRGASAQRASHHRGSGVLMYDPALDASSAQTLSLLGELRQAVAARVLPIGTAYAVWTGIGAVGTAVIGILVLGEPANAGRLVCIALIVGGVAGLKVFSA